MAPGRHAADDHDHDGDADAARSPFDPRMFARLVYLCVKQVPRGKVATYGQIARLCHHPRHSRHVGKALRALPDDTDVPWQRIINASSTISPRGDCGAAARRQAERLREEGVAVTQDAMRVWKVPSSAHWDAGGARTLDELLARGQGAGIKPEPPAANEAGRGGDGCKATKEQQRQKRKRGDRGEEEDEEEETVTVALKEEVQ